MSVVKIFGDAKRVMFLGAAVAMLGICGAAHLNARQNLLKLEPFPAFAGGSPEATSKSAQLAAEIAVGEINAAGGVDRGEPTTAPSDTQTDATVSVGEMKRLVLPEKDDMVIASLSIVSLGAVGEAGARQRAEGC